MTASAQTASAQDRVLNIQDTGKGFWHVEDNSLPIVTISFAFDGAGAVNDPVGKEGLSVLLSSTLDEGAGDRDAQAFQEALQDHAIELTFSSDRDHFSGRLKTLKRHAPLAFELLHDALTSPRFDAEAVERMRQANIMQIKSYLAKPEWQASRLMNDTLFAGHPYAKNSAGTFSGLNAMTVEDLRSYKQSYLTKSRLKIATSGDMTAEELAPIVHRIFNDLPDGQTPAKIQKVSYAKTPKKVAFKSNSPQSVVFMSWPAIARDDYDYHAFRVLDNVLGSGGFSSLLMEEVREKQGLTYGIYSQPTFMKGADYLSVESAVSPQNIEAMTQSVQQILTRLKQEDIDAEMLQNAKNYLVGSLPLRFSSTESLSAAALQLQLDGRPVTALDEWAGKINAVTAADVKRVANRVFEVSDPVVTVVAGAVPAESGFDVIATLPGVK